MKNSILKAIFAFFFSPTNWKVIVINNQQKLDTSDPVIEILHEICKKVFLEMKQSEIFWEGLN